MDDPRDHLEQDDDVGEEEALDVLRVVLVADVGGGTSPAASTGQPAAPSYADITTDISPDPARPPEDPNHNLHLYFDEGLAVLREQWWGSRSSLEEVLRAAELCGVPRDRWRHAHQDWPQGPDLPEALQPSTGPRLRAQRSYDIAVWPADGAAEACVAAAESYQRRLDSCSWPNGTSSKNVDAFLDEVLTVHPFQCTPDHAHNPWQVHPRQHADSDLTELSLNFWAVRTVLPAVVHAAHRHGLLAYDPQAETLL